MEHRYGRRSDSGASAGIYRSGVRLGEARIANFSKSGLYLRPSPGGLRPFQLIEIEVPVESSRRALRLRAGVVRIDRDGIGVQLDVGQEDVARKLDATLLDGG